MPDTPKPEGPRSHTVHTWLSSGAALIALGFSFYNFFDALPDPPETEVTKPRLIRVDRNDESGTYLLFLQPSISTRIETEAVEVITDAQLVLTPVGQRAGTPGGSPHFFWQAAVKWSYNWEEKAIWYEYAADPTPFTVTRDEPQLPSLQFASLDWKPAPGTLKGRLILHRASGQPAIGFPVCIHLEKTDVTALGKIKGGFHELRADVPGKPKDNCYRWFY
ncbi:hypothetical protein OG264_38530 (plasmid) [Streptomyces xanthophaeus]|uniref:hypothetical protein n=1 Tax=Streptomyces xanthophaeus TaxID=67385 RepID=UPI002F917791|nr:hypothetical protein OG264_38530 [Streptomyces xanthophaeus]WST65797.1 hypothetical protein OG605_40175 [Streptomyces xanthophaeus]